MGMMIHRRKEGHLHYPKIEERPKAEPKVEPETKPEVEEKGVVYTKEEISKLPFFSLKKMAASEGIDVVGKKTAELRAALIEKLEL